MDRNSSIIKTSLIGIGANLVLVAFKAFAGVLSNSLSVIMDAVNNLSDALGSIITIIGTKLANKAPDKKHPYGYGQIEYISSVTIAVIVLLAGITSFKESFEKIFNPEDVNYTPITLTVIIIGILTKLTLGRYVKCQGEKLNSESLIASGSDALFDAIITTTTLVSALIYIFLKINVEGILGTVISVFIVKSGVDILMDSLSSIIGQRVESDLSVKLKEEINSYPEVHGCYDLSLHKYGPQRIIGSVHIEVDDDMTARQLHQLTQKITMQVYQQFGIILTVGIYASNTADSRYAVIKDYIASIVSKYPELLQMHGFYVDESINLISFDLVYDFEAKNIASIRDEIIGILQEKYPDFRFSIILDNDYSD